jgi:hypothetical protein
MWGRSVARTALERSAMAARRLYLRKRGVEKRCDTHTRVVRRTRHAVTHVRLSQHADKRDGGGRVHVAAALSSTARPSSPGTTRGEGVHSCPQGQDATEGELQQVDGQLRDVNSVKHIPAGS